MAEENKVKSTIIVIINITSLNIGIKMKLSEFK
jgi:hypothetical protein